MRESPSRSTAARGTTPAAASTAGGEREVNTTVKTRLSGPAARGGPDRIALGRAVTMTSMTIRSLAGMDAQRQRSNVVVFARQSQPKWGQSRGVAVKPNHTAPHCQGHAQDPGGHPRKGTVAPRDTAPGRGRLR